MTKQQITWNPCLRRHSLFVVLLIWVTLKCNCSDLAYDFDQPDSISQKVQNSSLRVLKFNTIQIAFGEMPVSWEVFLGEKLSIQYQIGILIPIFRKVPSVMDLFPPSDMTSRRTMPFVSYGISSKIELRKYGKDSYFALQGMYKYSAYNNLSITIWDSDPTYESFEQFESKTSYILGIGIIMGRQKYMNDRVHDLYCGFGFRLRKLNGFILARKYPSPAGRHEIDAPFHNSEFYPFINFGIRFGKTFSKKQKQPHEGLQ
jgi:hypothetical protein